MVGKSDTIKTNQSDCTRDNIVLDGGQNQYL